MSGASSRFVHDTCYLSLLGPGGLTKHLMSRRGWFFTSYSADAAEIPFYPDSHFLGVEI